MNAEQIHAIKTAQQYEEHLNEWEHQYISDLADKPHTYELSDKQQQALFRIKGKVDKL